MTSDPGTNKSKRFNLPLIICVLISLTGFVFYALFNKQVFPAASLEMKLTKEEAASASRVMAEKFGYNLDKVIQTTTFLSDNDAKTVLEFKLGIKKANELMKRDVPVWIWRTRFCKELSKEQIYVAWTTDGQLKSVFNRLENDKKLPSLSKDDALQLAQTFVKETGKQNLTAYELFDSGAESKPNRLDQHFEWRKRGYPESELRIRVEVAGNQVSEYRYYLSPTDTWTREYKSIRENNELLGKIASFFICGFIAATIGAFIHGLNTHNIRWRFSVVFSAIVSVLFLLGQINNWTNTLDTAYDTSSTLSNFVTRTVIMDLLGAVASFLLSLALVGGAETVYRRTWPQHMAMPSLLSLKGMAQSDFTRKMIFGYLLVGGMMFWVISYYELGQKLGFFCPLDVDDYKVIGTACPAIDGALIGVSAAGLEEFTCRVVGLGLLRRWLKNFWLANIIQAVIWGFAHSQYPQQPSYARGVELTVVGLVFGCIINAFGVLPCFVAHYLYDAFLTVEPVFSSHRLSQIIPALFVLVPFLIGVWYSKRWARARNVPELDLSNATLQAPVSVEGKHELKIERGDAIYAPLTRKIRLCLLAVTVLSASAGLLPVQDRIGKSKQVTVDSHQALSLAKKYLHEDGLNDSGYQSEVEIVNKPDSSDTQKWQHVFEQLGRHNTEAIYNQTEPGLEWRVRFFKPLDPKSYWVYLNGDGSKRVSLVEDINEGPGKKLDQSDALKLVDDYIKKYRPELTPYSVNGRNKIERANRTDYKFDLNIPKFNAGSTAAKLNTEVKGDHLSDLSLDWDIPDTWLWPRAKMKWYQQADSVLRSGAVLTLMVAFLAWSIHILRSTSIQWKGALFFAGVGVITTLISSFNNAATLLVSYNTAETFNSFVGQSLAAEAVKLLLISIGYLLLCIVGFSSLKVSFPIIANQLRHGLLLVPQNSSERTFRSDVWFDAAIGSYAFIAISFAIKTLQAIAVSRYSPALHLEMPTHMTTMFSMFFPAIDLLTALLAWLVFGLMAVAITASLWRRFLNTTFRSVLFIIIAGIVLGASSWYWQDCVIDTISTAALLLEIWWFTTRVFRLNAVSYVFVLMEVVAQVYLGELVAHMQKIGLLEIVLASAIVCAPLVATALVLLKDRQAVDLPR